VTLDLDPVVSHLATLAEKRQELVGAEGVIWRAGEETSFRLGLGLARDGETVWRLACAGKPVVAVGIARLVQDGLVDLDSAVASYVPEYGCGNKESVSVRHLLTHTANMDRPHRFEPSFATFNREQRHARVCGQTIRETRRPGARSDYSDYSAWHLLGCIIEAVSDRPFADFIKDEVCDPLGMKDTGFSIGGSRYEDKAARIGIVYDLRGSRAMPLLFDRTELATSMWDPAHGGYGTMADLARFYREMTACLRGKSDFLSEETAHLFVYGGRGPMFDQVYKRRCEFGLGFMVDLASFGFGSRCSSRSFGHSGYLGTVLGVCDPEHDLVAALVLNGLVGEIAPGRPPIDPGYARGRRIVDLLYESVGIK
jgi:CubicO group peptidase (beta-lactamase class C family)